MKPAIRILSAAAGLFTGTVSGEATEAPGADPAVLQANTAFAFDLNRQLMPQPGNLFYSPYSISEALAMVCAGAGGTTEAEMSRVLHFTIPEEEIASGFSTLAGAFEKIPKSAAVLTVANSLWIQKDFHLDAGYIQLARTNYRAAIESVDFSKNAGEASRRINEWVGTSTNGKIQNLVPPSGLPPATRLLLCNAIYFKGKWARPFAAGDTRPLPFRITPQNPASVPTMHQRSRFRTTHALGLSLIELPYAEQALSMVILLPDSPDGLAQVERGLTALKLGQWLEALGAASQEDVDLDLPRFTATSQFSLSRQLASLGMGSAFSEAQADFSGMSGSRDLFLSEVVHKAYIEVNEEGTEAAAATGAIMSVTSYHPVQEFHADHPFLFLIRENSTGALLFLGRIVDPR